MPTILVIDDSIQEQHSLRRMLTLKGYDVLTASNGKEGLKYLRTTIPDVIVSDVFMPEMEGLETIGAIKKQAPQIPIILMTGSLNDLYAEIGLKLGAFYTLQKPFDAGELIDAIVAACAVSVCDSSD